MNYRYRGIDSDAGLGICLALKGEVWNTAQHSDGLLFNTLGASI